MTQSDPKNEAIKQAFKVALAETLHEQRDLLHEVFAFAEAIRDGRQTECVQRHEVFHVLEGRA
jgi:sulfur relay (sulfurtransferase) complex TusBCD TusD component (DsrE family)